MEEAGAVQREGVFRRWRDDQVEAEAGYVKYGAHYHCSEGLRLFGDCEHACPMCDIAFRHVIIERLV